MRTAKTLIRLGGCPGWSESSLGAQPFCWFCHVAAHIHSDPNIQDTCIHEHINNIPMYTGFKNMLFRKNNVFCFCFVLKKKYFGFRTVRKKISVFLSEENLEEKTQPSPPTPHQKIKWSVPKHAHMVSCYFLVYFHCNKQYKKQIKQTGIPGIRFFTVIFTDTTGTLVVSPAGWFWLALKLDSF